MAVTVTFAGSGDAFGSGGRFNTCFLVDAPGIRFCIDFGASSLIALNKLGIAHNTIDMIVLTHLHGDHAGGIPMMLADAMLGAKRDRPLTIAGPVGTTDHLKMMADALMPGMHAMTPKFPVTWTDMEIGRPNEIGPLTVMAYPAVHTRETNPTSVRIDVAGKTIAYTGDSAWTEDMPALANDADLLISECYFYSKPVPFHLNYPDLVQHRKDLRARRIVLTHMGPEMLNNLENVEEECAYDGLVVEL